MSVLDQRANALRDAVCQIFSATGAYSHDIPRLCKEALDRDNALLDAVALVACNPPESVYGNRVECPTCRGTIGMTEKHQAVNAWAGASDAAASVGAATSSSFGEARTAPEPAKEPQ